MKNGFLVISLDFELLWGSFDKTLREGREKIYFNARELVPELLALFQAFGLEVTWATVGMLFAESREEWKKYLPNNPPGYIHSHLSPYQWYSHQSVDPRLLFAPGLIEKILQMPGQEVGSHTYGHYYVLEKGQTPEQFRQDLSAAQQIAKDKFGLGLRSLVFPRNQCNHHYMQISKEEGFISVRNNPSDWYWKQVEEEKLLRRIFRTGDCFLPIGMKTSFPVDKLLVQDQQLPLQISASRFFKPYHPHLPLLNHMKKERIKNEMSQAARNGEVYHLWWHPHNMGQHPGESLTELKEILDHFSLLRSQYGMQSKNMGSLAAEFHAKSCTV